LEKINALSGLTQSGETAEEEEEEDNYYHQFFDTSLDEASHPQQHRSRFNQCFTKCLINSFSY
jgi:hypothetical protein